MKCFAFLRAVNVGGRTVRMDRLRDVFTAFGLRNVETFIASGNVIFETRRKLGSGLESAIEAHLEKSLGYDVATFVRTLDELRAVAASPAFTAEELAGGTLYVAFLAMEPSSAGRAGVAALSSRSDEFRVVGREVYWLRRSRDSDFTGSRLEKALGGVSATMRNLNTVTRLVAKYG